MWRQWKFKGSCNDSERGESVIGGSMAVGSPLRVIDQIVRQRK